MSSGTPETYPRLVGDIGGTNARFALVEGPDTAPQATESLRCADYADIGAAIEAYLDRHGPTRPQWAAIGIANPVTGDWIQMTNHHWEFSVEQVKRKLDMRHLHVINDFTALALSLSSLPASDLQQTGGDAPLPGAPKALLGPGTGLGVSGLVPCGNDSIPLSGEGGHVTLPAQSAEEAAAIAVLARKFSHVSAERVLSGPGLKWLHEALAEVRGVSASALAPEAITAGAIDGNDALCRATVDMFCAFLGTVAGNLALTLGARGGVYVGGGIVPKLGALFAQSPFRARFEAKGRFKGYLAPIPVYVIHARYPGLIGAAVALDRDLAG